MIVKDLKITNFRNIKSLKLSFSPKINLIYGDNAQGKTNIVESLGFLSMLKSFRNDENSVLIKDDEDFATIESIIEKDNVKQTLKSIITKTSHKNFINKNEIKKVGDFIGTLNIVTFDPTDVNLFKSNPRNRRTLLNDELSKISPSYYMALVQFNKILKERNELLKNENINKTLIEVLTLQYSKVNYELFVKRKSFIEELGTLINDKYKKLSGEDKKITIEYINQFSQISTPNDIYEKVMESYKDDCIKFATQIGVHRDDYIVKIDGRPIANYGSQGQNRLAAIALKLSIIDIFEKITGDKAVIVLDDALSELDSIKQKRLLEDFEIENQIFITTVHAKLLEEISDSKIKKFLIKNGTIGGE